MRFQAVMMLALAALATPAVGHAKLSGPIDLTQPLIVLQALKQAGYEGELKKTDSGTPYVRIKKQDISFDVQFYDCELSGCKSYQYYTWYKKEKGFNAALVNKWNSTKRFIQAAIDKDGDLATSYDVSAVGGTYEHFADTLEWWTTQTNELYNFLTAELGPPKK